MIFAKYHYDNLSAPSSKQLRLTGCPETSVRTYCYLLRNNPEKRSSHLFRVESLKSRKFLGCFPTRFRLYESKSSNTGVSTFRRSTIVEFFAEMNDWDQDDCPLATDKVLTLHGSFICYLTRGNRTVHWKNKQSILRNNLALTGNHLNHSCNICFEFVLY